MTIKVSLTIDDADIEAGISDERASWNASLRGDPVGEIDTDEAYATKVCVDRLGGYRGAIKRLLAEKIADLPADAVAEVAALVDTKMPPKLEAVADVEPIAEVKK